LKEYYKKIEINGKKQFYIEILIYICANFELKRMLIGYEYKAAFLS